LALGSGSYVIGFPLFGEIRDTDPNQKDPHRCRADLVVVFYWVLITRPSRTAGKPSSWSS